MKAGSRLVLSSGLTSEEIQVVKEYQDYNTGVNNNLLDSAINKSVTTKPMTLYRVAYDGKNTEGYVSTTKTLSSAKSIAYEGEKRDAFGRDNGRYKIIKFTLPSGSRALDVNKVTKNQVFSFEKEVLLPRGTKFKLGKSTFSGGYEIIEGSIVH